MPSLQVRHSRLCVLEKPWTPAAALEGCTCSGGPTYYVAVREGRKLHRERVGKNRRQAERALAKVQVSVDEGAFRALENVRFAAWADEWKASLRRPKANTVRSYDSTIAYAKQAFGERTVRRLTVADVHRFIRLMASAKIAPSTQAKHLRVLSSCLAVAVKRGYAARNPVEDLDESERPRAEERERPWFEDEELPTLFAKIPSGPFRTLFTLAVKTGMREGEILALTWGDVDLLGGVIHVRRNYTARELSTPKSKTSRRDVHVTEDVVELLGKWWAESGSPGDDTLVFPGRGRQGYLSSSTLTRRTLYPALDAAEIPRLHARTGVERDFHSFRHTFARIALENGKSIYWLSRHLGHSSTNVTEKHYGHFSTEAAKREVAELEGVFSV